MQLAYFELEDGSILAVFPENVGVRGVPDGNGALLLPNGVFYKTKIPFWTVAETLEKARNSKPLPRPPDPPKLTPDEEDEQDYLRDLAKGKK